MSELWNDESTTLTEALFEARDQIQALEDTRMRQGGLLAVQAIELTFLQENPELEVGRRYSRLLNAVFAIESFNFQCELRHTRVVPEIASRLFKEAIDYAETGEKGPLLGWAMKDATRAWAADAGSDGTGRGDT